MAARPRAAAAGPTELGAEIAAAVLALASRLVEARGAAFEVADPEPVLRGVAGAYAAIAQILPGGLDEAWALLGPLALELEATDPRRRRPEPGRPGPPGATAGDPPPAIRHFP